MQKLKDIIQKYYEGLAYLFFGGVATPLNLGVFAGFQAAFGTDFAAGIGNIPHVAFAAANGKLWAMGVKLFSQVIVIVSNYVFSKLFIFKKK